ncbi:PKD domain-containing protein, partial [Candidatus Bathyarchaeota archaeon]|nr:PKD domain-containing protein [Candidatus Bathyarchaeota archaeon]
TFDASASYAPGQPGGTIDHYTWDFDDGSSGTGVIVTHAYNKPGKYYVTLTVTDNENLDSTKTEDVTVPKLNSTITISASTLTVPISLNTTISGSISPVRENATVTINYTRVQETTWTTLANLSTNQNGQYSYVWTPTERGAYQFQAFWQTDDNITGENITLPAESHLLNVTVIIQDIAIVDVALSKIELTTGESLWINVTASNRGTATETFNVTVYYNNTMLETKTVNNLTAGTNEIIGFNWETQGIGEGVYMVKAVAEPLSGETYDVDNSRTYGIIIQAQAQLNVFLYTTIGMAIAIAVMAVYLVKMIKFKPK